MNPGLLEVSWHRCWSSLHARGDGLSLMQKLVAAYEEPQRKYHTLQHLYECLSLFEANLDLAVRPAEVEIALWFHDAVYNVKASDNEAKSADRAATELAHAGVAAESITHVTRHVLATRHSALPQGRDQMLLVDIDLAILGAPRPRFMEYEAQVQMEYSWVPAAIFREKRAAILREFLVRVPIYNTPQLHEMFELQARANLLYSLEMLQITG